MQGKLSKLQAFLGRIIEKSLNEKAKNWFFLQKEKIKNDYSEKAFIIAFSSTPRYTGKEALSLSPEDISLANSLREGFQPQYWTIDQATRVFFTLNVPIENPTKYKELLDKVFSTADIGEQTALYLSLPVLPFPEEFKERAAEGIRNNMKVVFEAVALHNPYPADYLNENAWNQLVLKTIFVGSPIEEMYGFDKRTNPTLATMLLDYAHERWAAGRKITPELWRGVAPFFNDKMFPEAERLVRSNDPQDQKGATLLLKNYQGDLPNYLKKLK